MGLLVAVALPGNPSGIKYGKENGAMQTAHGLALALFQYSIDHDGDYPEGKSSTAVFQKLIDGGYVTNPELFYLPLPGKTKGKLGSPLKPENVCWDVTCCVTKDAPDKLPLIFMTGYKVHYVPGGDAVPLIKPYPPYFQRTWSEWLKRKPSYQGVPGLAVADKDLSSSFLRLDTKSNSNEGGVSNFIPPNTDLRGKAYRQLTPDGILP